MEKSTRLPTSFGIHGTCVSVDVFAFVNDPFHRLTDKVAMRDVTIFSTNDERPRKSLVGLKHASNLHTMWLNTLFDGKKSHFMKENAGEYLIIDLTDERFDLFLYDGVVFMQQAFIETNFFEGLVEQKDIIKFPQSDFSQEEAESRIKAFCEQVQRIYPPDKIIVNEFYLAKQWIDGEIVHDFRKEKECYFINKSEQYFQLWYSLIEKYIPGCKVVHLKKQYCAYDKHPRKLSPCHPVMEYYEDTYAQLVDIVNSDYAVQRQIPLTPMPQKPIKNMIQKYLDIGCGDYVSRILSRIGDCTSFENKRLLWISSHEFSTVAARKLRLDKFAQLIILSDEAEKEKFAASHPNCQKLWDIPRAPLEIFEKRNFAYYMGQISQLTEDFLDVFDIIFVDDLEYIKEMSVCLDNLYKCLRRNGIFFAKTGRTWSSPTGSKWKFQGGYLKDECALPQWIHLLYTPREIADVLVERYKISRIEAMDSAVEIYKGSSDLNHLFYEDYRDFVRFSLFHKKSICPIFPIKAEEKVLLRLRERYPEYQAFEYKSLWICCEK